MLFSVSSRRLLCSAVLIMGAFAGLPGCKHAYRGGGIDSPLGSRRVTQPLDADFDDGPRLHSAPRFESLPDLSPVPPLPGAGHSLPGGDGVPPSPTLNSVSPTSLQSEPTAALDATPSATPSLSPVAESEPSRWQQLLKVPSFPKRTLAQPLPPLKAGRFASPSNRNSSVGSASSPVLSARPQSALMHSAQFALRPSSPALSNNTEADVNDSRSLGQASHQPVPTLVSDEAATLPVVTPMVRVGQIERWPHQAQTSSNSIKPRSMKHDESLLSGLLDAAQASPLDELPLPVATQTVEEAVSPALLPPGP